MLTASFGSGLPPAAAMSPPALWTRISIGPSEREVSSTTRSMSAPLVRSPSTRMVRTPCADCTASATAVSVVPSPYSAGPFSRMPCSATSAPRLASRSANARPRPRPAPVTSATLPVSMRAASFAVMIVLLFLPLPACGERSDRAAIRVRGVQAYPRTAAIAEIHQPPHPNPLPASGEREHAAFGADAIRQSTTLSLPRDRG